MKRLTVLVSGLIAGIFIGVSSVVVAANTDLVAKMFDRKIVVDGIALSLEEKPFIINNRTYLPLRELSEALGYDVIGVDSKQITLSSKTSNELGSSKNSKTNVGSEYVNNLYLLISTDNKIDLEKVKNAVSSGEISINAQDQVTGYSLYHYAVIEKNSFLYTYLKENKANASLQDSNGKTPLHHAVLEESNIFMSLLVNELNVSTQIEDNEGKKPIDYTKENSINWRYLRNHRE
jgi:Copper amine oxidase N-terminal domain.